MNPLFQLPSEMTIYSVGLTRDALLAWLVEHDPRPGDAVDIDAAQVEEIDGAGMQLLGALTEALTQRGLAWRVREPSAHLQEVCSVLGSHSWLERQAERGASA